MIVNMLITVLYLSLLLNSGLSVNVLQSADQVSRPGVTVILECSPGPGFSLQTIFMYWYRQKHYAAPIEFLLSELDFSVGHFQSITDQNKNRFSLQNDEVFLNDSSRYYCVASHMYSWLCVTWGSRWSRKHQHSEGDSQCDTGREAFFGKGTKLTVLEFDVKSPNVEVLRPSAKECRNPLDNERQKTLVCVASDFYPDHVSVFWQVDGHNVTSGVVTDEAALREGNFYKITSQLRVSAEDWYKPESTFECVIRFFNGTEYVNYPSSISGEPVPGNVLTREEYLRITQKAKLSYGVFIAKSCVYGAFVAFLVWRLQSSTQKQRK
ncbi:M1-specific T cell receptor beta chain-like [Limanda limanda]|uniref:M1-specific T cell receptor beta chain-like n=1 Tax=Limanda limanda TaxID=27771 RepID=UPI0029C61E35|nr:M1-specific T cell receptor beta chain-like [Limanda limanda]